MTDSETLFPEVQRTVLPNGARIVTEHIPSVRSIAVGAWVTRGSRDEADALSGISHFIEHMVFKGTRRRRMHHIAQRMESVGGYLNAYTSKEYTCYYARSLDDHLERAIDITCDLILNPVFPPKEVEKEKGVVIEEIKMYDDVPEDLIFDWFEEALYDQHPLGRPIIGYPETVRSFTRDDLLAYTGTHYTPGHLMFAVSGNVRHEQAVRMISAAFDRVERVSSAHERAPVNGYRPHHRVETRPIQQAHLVLGTRAYHASDPRRTALALLNTVLGSGMSSRLNQNIREKYGYCYHIYSFVNMLSDTGEFGVYMGTDTSKVERSKQLIFKELDKLVKQPISNQKLVQAKNQVKGSLMLGLEDLSNRMMRLGRLELYFEEYFTLDQSLALIDEVSVDDIHTIAADLFKPELFSSIVLIPETSGTGADGTSA